MSELFDLVAGTSTGSILTAALVIPDEEGKPKMYAQDVIDFYEEDGEEVF